MLKFGAGFGCGLGFVVALIAWIARMGFELRVKPRSEKAKFVPYPKDSQ